MSALCFICKTYSLSPTGTKVEMLRRLRMFASDRAEEDRRRQLGRRERVESNLEGKARHAIEEGDAFDDDADDEIQGYFYYAATGTEATDERRRSSATVLKKKSPSSINKIPLLQNLTIWCQMSEGNMSLQTMIQQKGTIKL